MRDVKTIEEKLGVALSNGIIGYKEGGSNLDVVMAFGMAAAGLGERSLSVKLLGENSISRSLATALLRFWLLGDCAKEAIYAAERMDMVLNAKDRTRFRIARARLVLDYWIAEECLSCEGRKWVSIPGTPTLSDVECPACKGTGKKAKPWERDTHADKADRLLAKLDEVVREVARATDWKLRG